MNRAEIVQHILNEIDKQALFDSIKKKIDAKVVSSLMLKEELSDKKGDNICQQWNANTMLILTTILEFLRQKQFYYTERVLRNEIMEQMQTVKESCRNNREAFVLEAMLQEDEAAIFALRRMLSLPKCSSFQNHNNNSSSCLEQLMEEWLHRKQHHGHHIRRSHSWTQ